MVVGKGVCDRKGVGFSWGFIKVFVVLYFLSSMVGFKYFMIYLNEIE